ncbi:MAG: hypothetical protein KA155_07995 [Alphaproteobacteria bacterium]|nr:hypothetical protein [Alphaproteobacteria bacterium]
MSFDLATHDLNNPDPWLALALDQSTFFDQSAKEALLTNNNSRSRKVLLPIIRPLARVSIALVKLVRIVIPNSLTSSKALHHLIAWGMRNFLSKEANYLIIRHFHIGSQILRFLNDNLAEGKLPSHPLFPTEVNDFKNNMFVQHDLNIYNFIIELNAFLQKNNKKIEAIPVGQINFSAIRDFDHEIKPLPDTWHNCIDLQSAIEIYTPLFAVFLSDDAFWRASNSLQLDETMAVYIAKMMNQETIMGLVNNKHPMVPLSTFEAGFRLMLHGLDTENLYGFIKSIRDNKQ